MHKSKSILFIIFIFFNDICDMEIQYGTILLYTDKWLESGDYIDVLWWNNTNN